MMKNGLYKVFVIECYDGNFTEDKKYWVYSDGPIEYIDDDLGKRYEFAQFDEMCRWKTV